MRIGRARFSPAGILLFLILLLALALRLHGLGFGLPALYDPDEPLFVVSALKLLRDQTLNPGWFGHPGTTTIYALAIIDMLVFAAGSLTGRLADTHAFATAIYTDPSIVVLPGRLFIALCGVGCVWLTFLIGRRLFGDRAGLLAALLLAVDPLHVQWSQVIRTDIQATLFMLACVLASIGVARHGRLGDYLWAGLWVGLGTATKWPAATIIACLVGAALLRMRSDPANARQAAGRLAIGLAASLAALLIVSPYILIDHQTVLANLGREARPQHLGATGGGLLFNLGWYVAGPMREAIGIAGLALAAIGIGVAARRPVALATIIPAFLVFLLAISGESLIWARWILPLLPFLSLFAAVAIVAVADRLAPGLGRRGAVAVQLLLAAALALPMLAAARAEAAERINDTRTQAAAWARAHIPRSDRIVLEHLAFDMLGDGWSFLFPGGDVGCIDGNKVLAGQVRYADVERWRNGRSILDLGTIDPARIAACWGDYAIISHLDRYQREPDRYRAELATYRRFLDGGTTVAMFRPAPGRSGGPEVRIVRLGPLAGPEGDAPKR